MPRWNAGLVNAFPIPEDDYPPLDRLKIHDDPVIEYNPNPLRFFDFPAELRNRIYLYVLFSKPSYRGANGRRKGSRVAALLVSKRFHAESSYALYTTTKFLVFPIQSFDFPPTVREIPLHYRLLISNLQMVVGSSWTDPPKSWRVSKTLARSLRAMKNVKTLKIFVELDPSHPELKKYRISDNFYTDFCGRLLREVLQVMPSLEYVQIDGNPGVEAGGPLVSRLRAEAEAQEKVVTMEHGSWSTLMVNDA